MGGLVSFDWAIKHLLRNKANFDILEGFLSELLGVPIQVERILESEGNKNHAKDKSNRVDLLALTAQKEHVIIEVQCDRQWDYLSRILYGTSKAVCEYLHEGDSYGKIPKIISVSIVYFDVGQGEDYLYRGQTVFKGLNCQDTLELNPGEMEIYYQASGLHLETPEKVFPEYYLIKVPQFRERIRNKIDEWIYFLKNSEIKPNFQAKGLQSAAKKLDVLALSHEERRAYEDYKEDLHDQASFNLVLEKAERDSRAKGHAEGHAEGGKEMQLSIANSLKKIGWSDADIAKHTNLSIEEVKAIMADD